MKNLNCETMTPTQVADRLGVSNATVIRYLEAGRLKGYQLVKGGWWRVSKESVLEFEKQLMSQLNGNAQPGIASSRKG